MPLRDLGRLPYEYVNLHDDIVADFYIPALQKAIVYKRGVGFFSSQILVELSQGLCSLAKRGGHIQLMVSITLSKEDEAAIDRGYDARDYATKPLLSALETDIGENGKSSLDLLAYLISSGIMDVKVALVRNRPLSKIYHEKIGIMTDEEGESVEFDGSSNETDSGLKSDGNYEDINVNPTWRSVESYEKCKEKEMRFDLAWNDRDKSLIVLPFPEAVKDKVFSFRTETDPKELLKKDEQWLASRKKREVSGLPTLEHVGLRDYQLKAIDSWAKKGYRGIFDMATGTGKTFAALGAVERIFKDKKRIFAVIVCPYTHLVKQWEDSAKQFGIKPVLIYGSFSKVKTDIERKLIDYKLGRIQFGCFITTNASFRNEFLQNSLRQILPEVLLIADEAHNFGGPEIKKTLDLDYPYRLALSATIERHGDPVGTQAIVDFFGERCITFSLEEAIIQKKLSPYKYYPVLVSLSDDELTKYIEISKQISKYTSFGKKDQYDDIPEGLKRLLIKRSRIVAGAEAKIPALLKTIAPYKNDKHMLIYCGAVNYFSDDTGEDEKQISAVVKTLFTKLGMFAPKFTAEENEEEREDLKQALANGTINALTAIKCLDEGVDIPSIDKAFILASSTNPKEYIQRRGRVLRLAKGKDFAVIFDFVTITRPLEELQFCSADDLKIESSLARKELERIKEFSKMSLNPLDSNKIMSEIQSAYRFDLIGGTSDE